MQTSYKKYLVWQRAHELALDVYKTTNKFPSFEQYGLTSQLRRAAYSVPANFVEGYSRGTTKEFLRFLEIARASLTELEYGIEFARDISYLTAQQYDDLEKRRAEVGYLLKKFMDALRNRQK